MTVTAGIRNADKAYTAQMRANLSAIIDKLDQLSEVQRDWLKERWLDQVIWMEGRANRHRNRYYRLRVFAIVGGILIPLLITLSQVGGLDWLAWVAATLGALVAIAASIEEFYHDGERWRNYRNSVELLKSEGWHFINLSGPYRYFDDGRSRAFKKFAARVEDIIQQDVQTYLGDIVGDTEDGGEKGSGESD